MVYGASSHEILEMMKTPEDVSAQAYKYIFGVLLRTGTTVFYNIISNIMRALGDSRTPSYFLIFSGLNVILYLLYC